MDGKISASTETTINNTVDTACWSFCALRSISSKDNGAMRPVCTNLKLNADGNGWGANSCYDVRLDQDECPFVEGE